MMPKEKQFKSKLGPIIQAVIEERTSLGLSPQSYLSTFYDFDSFINNSGFDDGKLSKELIDAWSIQRPQENTNTRNSRVNATRVIARYMISLGMQAYLPQGNASKQYGTPYIPTREEIYRLFTVIDSYRVNPSRISRFEASYPVMFRLYYCYGMRLNEVVALRHDDIDFTAASIYIRHSKGDKDRIIYLKEDMVNLLIDYDKYVDRTFVKNREWFFPGNDNSNHLSKTGICKHFKNFWQQAFPDWKGKYPTTHSLRHAFVVHRINDWIEEGNDAEVLFPYISRFIGHSSIDETMYYYHAKDTESHAWYEFYDETSELLEADWL